MLLANAALLRPAGRLKCRFRPPTALQSNWKTHEKQGAYALHCLVCIAPRLIDKQLPAHDPAVQYALESHTTMLLVGHTIYDLNYLQPRNVEFARVLVVCADRTPIHTIINASALQAFSLTCRASASPPRTPTSPLPILQLRAAHVLLFCAAVAGAALSWGVLRPVFTATQGACSS